MKNTNLIIINPLVILLARLLWLLIRYKAPFYDFAGTIVIVFVSFLITYYFVKFR